MRNYTSITATRNIFKVFAQELKDLQTQDRERLRDLTKLKALQDNQF
jgi:hypothetical protein